MNVISKHPVINAKFDLSNISKLRNELMGVGAFLILICHSVGNNVLMPNIVAKIADNGQIGVDIFLFLSGLGLAYSLNQSVFNNEESITLWKWYKRRYCRVLFPFFLLTTPYLLYKVIFEDMEIVKIFPYLLNIEWWISGEGVWYVSLILVLYAIAPLLYKVLYRGKYKWLFAFSICLFIMFLCNDSIEGVLKYFSVAFRRATSFVIGMALAEDIRNSKTVNCMLLLIISFVIFIAISAFCPFVYCRWLIIIPLILLSCSIISTFRFLSLPFCFMGVISLESYLANIFLGDILNHKSWVIFDIDVSYGHYLEYLTVLVFGVVLAYWSHLVINKFFMKKY